MFRKAFLTIALVAFCLGTVIGCAKPASKAKPTEKSAAATEKADAKADVTTTTQAPPSVSE